MSMKPIQTTTFHNPSTEAITFRLGHTAGQPPDEFVIGPGEELKGPVLYEPFYLRQGLKMGPAPKAERQAAEARRSPPVDASGWSDPIDDIMSAGVPPEPTATAAPEVRRGPGRPSFKDRKG